MTIFVFKCHYLWPNIAHLENITNLEILPYLLHFSEVIIRILIIKYFIVVGRICNNFEKNRAFYDKSMKLGTWLVDNKTKKIRVSATPKMPSNGRHLVFPKWPPFFNLFIIISLFICKHHVFFS